MINKIDFNKKKSWGTDSFDLVGEDAVQAKKKLSKYLITRLGSGGAGNRLTGLFGIDPLGKLGKVLVWGFGKYPDTGISEVGGYGLVGIGTWFICWCWGSCCDCCCCFNWALAILLHKKPYLGSCLLKRSFNLIRSTSSLMLLSFSFCCVLIDLNLLPRGGSLILLLLLLLTVDDGIVAIIGQDNFDRSVMRLRRRQRVEIRE